MWNKNIFAIAACLVVIPPLSSGREHEYICNNSTLGEGDFQITFLLNLHYGKDCEFKTHRWRNYQDPSSQFSRNKETLSLANISLNVVDTCGKVEVVAKAIAGYVPMSWAAETYGMVNNNWCSAYTGETNVGFVTEMQPAGWEAIEGLLHRSDLPIISVTDDFIRNQTTVISTGYNINLTLEMMSLLMVQLEWDYVTVVYSDDALGEESFKIFSSTFSYKYRICIARGIAVSYSTESVQIDTRAVVYLGSEGIGYSIFIKNIGQGKVWVTSLDVSGLTVRSSKFYSLTRQEGDPFTTAVTLLEQAITETRCLEGNAEQCAETKQFRRELSAYVDRNSRGGIHSGAYNVTIHSMEGKKQVATVTLEGGVTVLSDFGAEPSLCNPDILNCTAICGVLNANDYTYIHGDHMILVTMPIHKEVNEKNRWSCSGFTNTSLFRTEAAYYALTYLKQRLNDNKIGMLILDSCGDKLRAAGDVYRVLKGEVNVCDKAGLCFNPKSVVALIGDYRSSFTRQVQTITREIPIIQMAYGASSITLNDREEYPYFLRTNPPDDLQAHFMIELLKMIDRKSGSEINAVNLIYGDGLYGRTGAERVRFSLDEANICVHYEKSINETGENDFEILVQELLNAAQTQPVKIIIVFLDPEDLDRLMEAVKKSLSSWHREEFTFIFSDIWNDENEMLVKYGDIVRGSFSFKINTDFESTGITEYLERNRYMVSDNPWLSTLQQEAGKCKIRGNFHSSFSKPCNLSQIDLSSLVNESFSVHLMKAIASTVAAIRQIVHDKEDVQELLFDPDSIDYRYNRFLEVEISKTLEGGLNNQHPFTGKDSAASTYGNGQVGYTIFNIKVDDSSKKPIYLKVQSTTYSISDDLEEFIAIPAYYNSLSQPVTGITSTSEMCTKPQPEIKALLSDPNSASPGLVAGIAVISALFVLMITGLGIRYIAKCRHRKKKNGPHAFQSPDVGSPRRESIYNEIPYNQYMSDEQKNSILRFVTQHPGTLPPAYMFEPELHKPKRQGRYADRPVPEIPYERPGGTIDDLPTYVQIPYSQVMSETQREEILKFVAQNPGSALPSHLNLPLRNCYYNGPSGGALAYNQSQNGFRAPQASTAVIDNPTFGSDSRELVTVIDRPLKSNEAPGNNSPAPKPAPRKTVSTHGMSVDEASAGNVSRPTDPNGTLPKDYANGKLFVSM